MRSITSSANIDGGVRIGSGATRRAVADAALSRELAAGQSQSFVDRLRDAARFHVGLPLGSFPVSLARRFLRSFHYSLTLAARAAAASACDCCAQKSGLG